MNILLIFAIFLSSPELSTSSANSYSFTVSQPPEERSAILINLFLLFMAVFSSSSFRKTMAGSVSDAKLSSISSANSNIDMLNRYWYWCPFLLNSWLRSFYKRFAANCTRFCVSSLCLEICFSTDFCTFLVITFACSSSKRLMSNWSSFPLLALLLLLPLSLDIFFKEK